MRVNGANHYFDNYKELEEFLMERNFKFEIPIVKEEDLKRGNKQYCVEIRNDKIVWCSVENLITGNCHPFYDDVNTQRFTIADIMSLSEAAKEWGLDDSTLRKLIKTDKVIEGVDYRKSGNVWIITRECMHKIYGKNIKQIKTEENYKKEAQEKRKKEAEENYKKIKKKEIEENQIALKKVYDKAKKLYPDVVVPDVEIKEIDINEIEIPKNARIYKKL